MNAGRPPRALHGAGYRRGAVSAPHFETVSVGQAVLREGGNAIEAMVAMAASIAAVYPHMNHIGGDGFWLIREPSGQVRALMGAGPAGANATIDFYHDHGQDKIPARGPLAALTVPGAVATWILALDLAKTLGGRLPIDLLLSPAARQAREGYRVTRSQASLTRAKIHELNDVPGFAPTFLADGLAPDVETKLKQAALAETLERLSRAGLEDFYRGDVGREIARDLDQIGSPVTRQDLESYRATMANPLSVNVRCGTLFNTPLPTQGIASLMILALFDRLNVSDADDYEYVHGLVEATKRAFRVRDRVVTDPRGATGKPDFFLSEKFLDHEVRAIDPKRAAPWPAAGNAGDTIWMGAADSSGLVVSYIQSIFWEFGSGCVLPETGVLMQNRGASFSLDAGAINRLAPGRLPFHTLNPAIADLNDGRIIAYGTMGGDGQPQTQAITFTRHVIFRQPLDVALDRPRWLLGRTWGSEHTNLRLEPRFEPAMVDRLSAAGHEVELLNEPYSDIMGHAGTIVWHGDGTMEAAHDPRADGGGAGL
ncbi:gamma-glutamyltransferase family protein [Bradyrhizobium sp. WSM1417]|uniref:gamma-glutamyltransferase family protein n=1 Tax=Bradyrhizobium sp. WSM1417 TaxID=754500 RepID=UPI0004B252F1|nr:gamma-glutamyltransferase [Bradyrhizobium sp. WSM1417]